MRTDVHQHLWSEPLVAALAARETAPRIRRHGLVWRLDLPGEASCPIDVAGDDPDRRAGLVALDGVDRALIALSTALGVEALPGEEAEPLLDAYHEGVATLPEAFGGWAAVAVRDADPDDLDDLLDRGAAGLCLPSAALATPDGLERCGPLLARLERRGAPLFVHPGPDPWTAPAAPAPVPAWWPALTGYVTSMHDAWMAFAARGRREHPRLRVLFAMLAGGAPLHVERMSARGGPADRAVDPNLFYDVSSYGARMVDAMVRVVGIDQLVHGSDRPVVAPPSPPGPLGHAAWEAMTRHNPARLLRPAPRAVAA